jgi:hypothetical protein
MGCILGGLEGKRSVLRASARLILVPLAAGCLAAPAGASAAARGPEVKVQSSGDRSERVDRLPIERRSGRGERVVISLTPKRMPSLAAGDRLELSTELQLTVGCTHSGPRCVGDPYHYNPDVQARMILAPGPHRTRGRKVMRIGRARREVCRQRLPNREHHCVLVFDRTIPELPRLPCVERDRCFVNLVASASSPRAHRGEFVTVGGNLPNGSIPQDRGRLNVVRFHPAGRVPSRRYDTTRRVRRHLRLDQRREVVYSQRLDGLEAGDQLVAEARARVGISHLPYNVVLSSQLILTDRRGATRRGRAAKLASLRGEISESNGFNCTLNLGVCTIHKVGVVTMLRDARRDSGRPRPLFVSLVTRAGPKRRDARPGDRAIVRRGGWLRLTRYAHRFRG